MAMVQPMKDRWEKLRERLRDAARMPIIFLLIFASGLACWVLGWTAWRVAEWLYHTFLSESWVELALMAQLQGQPFRFSPPANPIRTAVGAGLGSAGAGREVIRIVRRRFRDGRVLEFIGYLSTEADGAKYVTWEVSDKHGPVLDCGCEPLGPQDAVSCKACSAIACARRHSNTCQKCGEVFCSGCLEGISIEGIRAVACKPCAEELTASPLKRAWKSIGSLVWGRTR